MEVVFYVLVCCVPAAAFALADRALTWFTTFERRAREPDEHEVLMELNRYRRDLRRLGTEHSRVLVSDQLPAKGSRLRAIELAYDDTLRRACEALKINDAPRPPIDAAHRLQVEADLAAHGFTW